MGSNDAFTAKISEIMDSRGNGTTKFKDLSKSFVPLMDSAESVAVNITAFFNTTDRHDLFIAAQKLKSVYNRLKSYYTVERSKFRTHRTPPPPGVHVGIKTIVELVYIQFDMVEDQISSDLDTNLTMLNSSIVTCCHYVNRGAAVYKIAEKLAKFSVEYARTELRGTTTESRASAVDDVYGELHDIIFKLSFFHPICFASGELSGLTHAEAYEIHLNYKAFIVKFFLGIDRNIGNVLRALFPSSKSTTIATTIFAKSKINNNTSERYKDHTAASPHGGAHGHPGFSGFPEAINPAEAMFVGETGTNRLVSPRRSD
ncbi:hypothetical protein DdX_18048 [Ditylenchus destructor]|uniref:Uncharacterized protein n=1 Tax=Ditylenchus destructor TaxID=166010 RepID=A0AAD4MLX0_9BILA|nr:hypothetical protein DdX_18048 [Ditylenchus destructor]